VNNEAMQRSYGVVWREGTSPLESGKLELLPRGLRLDGPGGSREISYDALDTVRVGRSAADRIDGRPSVVVEWRGGEAVTIAAVAQSSVVGEIAEQLVARQLRAGKRPGLYEELSYLPTPGAGDSDGGDIF
jgi:hypothetical protein